MKNDLMKYNTKSEKVKTQISLTVNVTCSQIPILSFDLLFYIKNVYR